jgi:two-component sensor histidine kinase
MKRIAFTLLLLFVIINSYGQSISAQVTVKSYSLPKKRLLAVSTAEFINFISQNNLDQDSVMSIACRITGLPFLLPYTEGIIGTAASAGVNLSEPFNVSEAVKQLKTLNGERRIRLLLILSTWYLHHPGSHKTDLDNANCYLEMATRGNNAGNNSNLQIEGLFLRGELYAQQGDIRASKKTFDQIISSQGSAGNMKAVARAWQYLGKLMPHSDSKKLLYFKNSFAIYYKLQFKEREIELLGDIADCHDISDRKLEEKDLRQILSLQQSIGFKHVLFAKNELAFVAANQAEYIDALKYANAAMENMRWSGINAVSGAFYIRIATLYWGFEQKEKALFWFKKALDSGTADTHVFWYKSLFFSTSLLMEMNRPGECLTMIENVTSKYPPVTAWEKMQLISCKGLCYEKLKKPILAGDAYMELLEMANNNPSADTYHELADSYADIAIFYVAQGDIKKTRLFLKAVGVPQMGYHSINSKINLARYKIDSLTGNFKSAMRYHARYELYRDSDISREQIKKFDELAIKSTAEKNEQHIQLLNQQKAAQQISLKQNKVIRNILITGAGLLLIILLLLFSRYKIKQRTNKETNKKNRVLQHLLTEKEWLLKEVHHRVKNNLHTVICLLESQAAYLENDARKAIENSQHRIYAMSLIHQKLYQSEDIKTVDMSVYLPDIVRYLNESFGKGSQIRFDLDIDPLKLGVFYAVPLSLIINESITNCIKYAFPNGRRGVINISMHQTDETAELMIADNGIGIDSDKINGQVDSLGLKLMRGLSEDIQGCMSIENINGTTITIKFKIDESMYAVMA